MATTYATAAEFVAVAATARINVLANAKHSQMLEAAAEMVDRYTRGYRIGYEAFSASTSETRYYDDFLVIDGVLYIDDAVTVTAVTRAGTTVSSGNYYTYPYNAGEGPITQIRLLAGAGVIAPPFPIGAITYGYPFERAGVKQYAVTGTWGYCTQASRPPLIKEATLTLAVRMYELSNLGKDNMVQLALAGGDVPMLDKSVAMMLNKYKRLPVVV